MKTIVDLVISIRIEGETKDDVVKTIKEYEEALRGMGFGWISSEGEGLRKWTETYIKPKPNTKKEDKDG